MSQPEAILDLSDVPSSDFSYDMLLGGIKEAMTGVKSRDLWMLAAADIPSLNVMEGLNVRVKDAALDAHVRSLANSMKSIGFKASRPLEVVVLEEDGKLRITVTDGHCRLAAVRLAIAEGAAIKAIPLVTLPSKGTNLPDLVAGLVLSNTGKELTPFEKSLVCKRLLNYGWSEAQIAQRLDYSVANVNLLLDLASAPLSIVTMVQKGEVSANFAVETMRKHRGEALKVLQEGLAVAKSVGKKSVTKKYMPGAALEGLVKRKAGSLYETMKDLTEDPGYSGLTEANRSKLNGLLADIAEREKALDEKLKKAAEEAAKQQQQEQGEKEEATA